MNIYVIMVIDYVKIMTTISVSEDVKQKLLKVASELQIKRGRRVDLNEALSFLVDQREKKPHLLGEACMPMSGAKKAIEELRRERKVDETRLERKISRRHKCLN
jgi:predicted CopG family antitoxin